MSATTVRRIKERGGSGGKITALNPSTKTLTPLSEITRKSSGKENTNTRSISATRSSTVSTQKPFIKQVPIPRIEKSASQIGNGSGGGVRWSTSSVPRGRSSSPSDFARLLSDRMSRVSVSDRSSRIGAERGGRSVNGARVLEKPCSQKSNLVSKSKFVDGVENGGNGVLGLGHSKYKVPTFMNNSNKNVDLNLNLTKSSDSSSIGALKSSKNKSDSDLKVKIASEKSSNGESFLENCKTRVRESANGGATNFVVSSKGVTENGVKVFENQKENVNGEEVKGVRVGNKYSSKLHEKLAFLEGKVKRIASDIKKTKEMLDMNNPDSSKTIISDIQDKISGIEKAMGQVVNDKQSSLDVPKVVETDNKQAIVSETTEIKQVDPLKPSVKDLNREELEARLLPHHKLLRGRTSLQSHLAISQNDHPPQQQEPSGDSTVVDMVLSPTEESIAMEFLDSLSKDASKVSKRTVHASLEFHEVQEMDGPSTSAQKGNLNALTVGNCDGDVRLTSDETFDEFDDDQENRPEMVIEETGESCTNQLNEIGWKTSTGGWFVSEGESVLLAHDDGSCTYYDITNSEAKAEYKPPAAVSPNLWGDCWLIRAPDSDGCSGRYVVAASSGSTLDSGFCAWDFYTKDVRSFHVEGEAIPSSSRTVLGPLPNKAVHKRSAFSPLLSSMNQQWWYKPCGHLVASTASSQRRVSMYDIRDGEQILNWEIQKPVLAMEYSSPMQWRNRGKVVVSENETISLWDVNSLTPQTLLSIKLSGRKVSALHVNNTDAELGGGVRRRVSSSEVEGHDGVFCTQDTINVLDFRLPSGVGLKISKIGVSVQSIFSRGDSIFLGCTDGRSTTKEHTQSCIQQFSLRKAKLLSTYTLPESNTHSHYSAISQVWGNSDFVMGICGLGLFVFDASKDEEAPYNEVREIIGPADMYSPSFDYLGSRVLLISRDRPAMWRYLS